MKVATFIARINPLQIKKEVAIITINASNYLLIPAEYTKWNGLDLKKAIKVTLEQNE